MVVLETEDANRNGATNQFPTEVAEEDSGAAQIQRTGDECQAMTRSFNNHRPTLKPKGQRLKQEIGDLTLASSLQPLAFLRASATDHDTRVASGTNSPGFF